MITENKKNNKIDESIIPNYLEILVSHLSKRSINLLHKSYCFNDF